MGQIPYGSARTTHAVRSLIQRSCASNAALSRELGINIKTVSKWRKRAHLEDAVMGPKEAHSTVLSIEQEAVIVAFRRHTLLFLDDCLYALQPHHPISDALFFASLPAAAWDQQIARGRRRQA